MQVEVSHTEIQDDAFYADMGDAMMELSVVFERIGLEPDEVRTVARLLALASGLKPVTNNDDDLAGS